MVPFSKMPLSHIRFRYKQSLPQTLSLGKVKHRIRRRKQVVNPNRKQSLVSRVGTMFGEIHSLVMAMAVNSGKYFLVSDLQSMTNLPPCDVAFAVRDLYLSKFIVSAGVPGLFVVMREKK